MRGSVVEGQGDPRCRENSKVIPGTRAVADGISKHSDTPGSADVPCNVPGAGRAVVDH